MGGWLVERFVMRETLREGRGLGMVGADAGVAELADAQVLGACGEIRVGSSPSARRFLRGGGRGVGAVDFPYCSLADFW